MKLRTPSPAPVTLAAAALVALFRSASPVAAQLPDKTRLTVEADLADYLIGETNRAAGCDDTATFDRALRGEDGFTVLS